jgi:hypothetical protein
MRKPPCPKCGLPLASYCSPEPRCWKVDGEKCLDRQLSAANARIAVLERESAGKGECCLRRRAAKNGWTEALDDK